MDHGHAGEDAMIASRQQLQKAGRLGLVSRLFQQTTPHSHHSVGGQDHVVRMAFSHDGGLGTGQALGQTRRRLGPLGRFVDVGRIDQIGRNADQRQQLNAARARRGQDQPRSQGVRTRHARPYLKR